MKKKLIGRIIFSNFLNIPLWKYYKLIEKSNAHPIIVKWVIDKLIKKQNISSCLLKPVSPNKKNQVIARIHNYDKSNIKLQYVHPFLQYYYDIDQTLWNNLNEHSLEKRLLHQLIRINSRNILTHCLLEIIIEFQETYIQNNELILLKPLTRRELAKMMERCKNNSQFMFLQYKQICYTWICRLIPQLLIATPTIDILPISLLLPNNSTILKYAIQNVMYKENQDMINEKLKQPFSDIEIMNLISDQFNINTTKRNINALRNLIGIPSAGIRFNNYFYLFNAPFSKEFPFTLKYVNMNVTLCRGVYELRFRSKLISYLKGKSPVFYIGSSKNLKKRLTEHIRTNTKKTAVKYHTNQALCNFRFYTGKNNYKHEEKRLYDLFIKTFGEPPIANKVSPANIKDKINS